MKLYYADHFVLPLPEGHRFPMEKYSRLRQTLMDSGVFAPDDFRVPEAVDDATLQRAHTPEYIRNVVAGTLPPAEQRRIGFPWSAEMVERSRRSAGATLAACRSALEDGCGANLAGGTHHAGKDYGSGFCVFNDAAVATLALRAEGHVRRVAVIDCDVHQGDGTAHILGRDPDTYTLSMHGARNFPFRKMQSRHDIELDDGAGDAEYLPLLDDALYEIFHHFKPDLAIYLAGADPFEGDRLGRLSLSREGLAQRDDMVLAACQHHRVPVAIAMAGGYGHDISDTVAIHATTLLTAARRFKRS